LASRRTVFKQLEQFAGVLAGKLSSNRFVGDQWNELRIDLAASNKRRRPDEPLFTATRSRAWLIVSASTIAAPRSPNESTQSPISPPPAKLLEKDPIQLSGTRDFSQDSCWASRLADSGRPMIVLVASRCPCVATGIGRATGNCYGSIGAFGDGKPFRPVPGVPSSSTWGEFSDFRKSSTVTRGANEVRPL
jgi:hypothetical protein